MTKRRRIFPVMLLPLLIAVLFLNVFAAGKDDISVTAGSADDTANYYSEESSGMADTQVDQEVSQNVSQDEAYQENNDGDDTYVSNDGTVFQIPRVEDTSQRVYDFAGLFTEEEKNALREEIKKVEEKKNCDIVLLTSNDVPRDANYSTETSMRYARQFLVDNGFDANSFIAIIDMNNRVFWACGYGDYGTQKYAGWGQKVYDKVLDNLKDRDYMKAADKYIDEINRLNNPLLAAIPTALSLIISAVLALVTMLGFNIRHNSSQPSKANTPPVQVLGYRSKKHDEHYMGTTMHRRHIPRNTGGGGGGHGGGFSGGGFSSGSGGSFSGGGGHF